MSVVALALIIENFMTIKREARAARSDRPRGVRWQLRKPSAVRAGEDPPDQLRRRRPVEARPLVQQVSLRDATRESVPEKIGWLSLISAIAR
jgi:hypothetical protein